MKSIPKLAAMLLAALTLAVPLTPVLAHDDVTLDAMKAPNGGQLRMAGIYHFELVLVKNSKEAKENSVLVFVTDHAGTKIATAGASGTVTLLAGKLKASVTLVPDGDNRLKGVAKYASSADMKAVVAITMAGKQAEQARFTPMAAGTDEHMHHKP
ncbi:MAG: hypothetical protein RLZ81_110 [Pseudomonadota bacterium]|jgi:L-ascorbate metabolism protein UlaG (beta-lactamase superfamily)